MAEELTISESQDKNIRYQELLPQIGALVNSEKDLIANMANIAAALKQSFDFLWVGFYIVKGQELVLGPFQGPIACTRILKGKGVCGHSWQKKETIIVADVNQFTDHIACSSDSLSEIVVPALQNDEVLFVLDVDSNMLNDFNETDRKYLNLIVDMILNNSIY